MADNLLKALDKRIDANEKAIKAVEKSIDKRISNLEAAVKTLASAMKGKLDLSDAQEMDEKMFNKVIAPLIAREGQKMGNKAVKEAQKQLIDTRIKVIEARLNGVEALAKQSMK